MSYNKTFWKDHVTEFEDRFREVLNPDGTITHESVEGQIIQQGTPQNAQNFNKIEDGIFSSNELGAELTRIVIKQGQAIKNLLGEIGTVTLTNTLAYPFNNSKKTVALSVKRDTMDYTVEVEATAAGGDVGKVIISDKQLNGFKIEHTGSAASVTVKYIVKGGMY